MSTPHPGIGNQTAVRSFLRVAGPLAALAGLALFVVAVMDLVGAMGSLTEEPDRFWMAFVGLPLLFVGSAMAMYGYYGSMARYAAGETMPVVKDSAAYLTDGHGAAGVGRTVDDRAPAAGPYCRGCGTRNDSEARFCDSCGQSLA